MRCIRYRARCDGGPVKDKAKQKALILLLATVIGCAPFAARAEAPEAEFIDYNDYVQTVYRSNNGLPCGEANAIAQTNDGILWIGTYAGLYRYNGSEFEWMDGYDSVRNVNCLYVDEEGRLWIGTNDNGLSICINERIANVINQSRGLPSNSVRSIVRSSDGYYYIGTTGSMQILTLDCGLKRLNTLWEVYYADVSAADAFGRVAAISNDGRLFLMKKGQILSSLRLTDGEEQFTCCRFNSQGQLLVGTSTNHIYVYDISDEGFAENRTIIIPGLSNLNDLYYLDTGELFVSTDSGVGCLRTNGAFYSINTNDFNNSIDKVLVDYQGKLWFTSSRLGLLRMAPSSFKDVYSTIGMSSRVVNAVARWQGNYYIGTDKGLDVIDEACRRRVYNALTEKLQGVCIRCMLADSEGSLWLCTYGSGLWEVEPDGAMHAYTGDNGGFGSRARLVTELSDGTILAGGDTGISFLRDHKAIRTIGYADGLINSMILTVTELPDGRLIVGTDGDGIAVIEDGRVTRMLTRADGLSSEVILRTVKDEAGGGVFIFTSNGLCYMEAGGAIRSLDSFPYFNNYDMWVKEDGKLFVMSSAGLYVVEREPLLAGAQDLNADLLDARQGLNSALTANSWHYCNEKGELFLPCDTGVFIIDTNRYTTGAARSYRMSLSTQRLDNEPVSVERSQPITIGRDTARVEMFPEIINYSIQDPYVGYWLEGFDSDWTILPESDLSSVVYTNLPTGTYTFHLAVFDNARMTLLEERTYILKTAPTPSICAGASRKTPDPPIPPFTTSWTM